MTQGTLQALSSTKMTLVEHFPELYHGQVIPRKIEGVKSSETLEFARIDRIDLKVTEQSIS
jgi:hypothetical protein